MDDKIIRMLADRALKAKENAYAPYSGFKVGAALLTGSGRVYTGCNVENVSYGAAICAERAAVCAAVAEGERDFAAIAVCAGDGTTPCGICRQVLAEFNPKMTVIYRDGDEYVCCSLDSLLPHAFDKINL